MALQYLAGQRLTADALQRAVPDRVEQAADQSVTSSVTPVDSAIAITVDGLLKIDLEVRYTSGGGGIRWIWDADAGVTFMSRSVGASGSATSGSQTNVADKIGRASCRERVCQYVSISVVAVSLKKKNTKRMT